jgi:hypothetical protein
MAGANSNIQIADLDFNTIKNNLKTFLKSQDTLKDYNYEGSALATLLDVLAYNTQYNSFYLNMVANEMFLDTALQRNSVVSHAKLLNYTPKSAIAPAATINLKVNQVTQGSLTLPKFTKFMSEAVDGVNYNFVTMDSATVNVTNGVAQFNNVVIKQGIPTSLSFTVNNTTNPKSSFLINDAKIDTTTLRVGVQQSSSNTYFQVFTQAENFLELDPTSTVYFLQETLNSNYEISFGDGIIGQQLTDGNIVTLSYLSTDGTGAAGANSFALMQSVGGFANTVITPVTAANEGSARESIASIKYQAPKAFSAQGRAVSKEDYITVIQQNKLGFSFDAVNVWGGEENNPPQFGKIFVSVKPTGGYRLTDTQKDRLITSVIKPVSVMTVTPQIVDVDYVYVVLEANVIYDSKKTNLTSAQIQNLVRQGTIYYCNTKLNTFNSTFVIGDLIQYAQNLDRSIVAVDYDLYLQKRLVVKTGSSLSYVADFGNALERSIQTSESVQFAPSFSQYDSNGNFYPNVYLEESPDTSTNVDTVNIIIGGTGYTNPTITISGDGVGAKAFATVVSGVITGITVTEGGAGYTQAVVTITDSTGSGAVATAMLRTDSGVIRSFYFENGVKNILSGSTHTSNAGSIDYTNGVITLANFAPYEINDTTGLLYITGYAESRIVQSTHNKVLTLDSTDAGSVTVTVTAK